MINKITKCPISAKCKDFETCEIKNILEKYQTKKQECEELRGRLNTICFDPRTNNNRCISYNRMAEDYEKDLKKIDKYKQSLDEIEYLIKELFLGVQNKDRPYCEKILDIINKAKENN